MAEGLVVDGEKYDIVDSFCYLDDMLTISVRQAGVAAHCAVTREDGRPLDRHASGDPNVKF